MAALMNMRHSASLCNGCFRILSTSRPTRVPITKPGAGIRRLAYISPESQHKVDERCLRTVSKLTMV